MPQNIKLAFFDIDGTLIGNSGMLTARTKQALNLLGKAGVHLALATGRPLFGALNIARELEIDCFSLFSSGSILANPSNNEILFEASIDSSEIAKCIELARQLGLYIELYSSDSYFIESESDITEKHTTYLGLAPHKVIFEEVIGKTAINKLVIISDNEELDRKQEILCAEMKNLICLCSKGASHPEITFNNITSPAANRQDGFRRILDRLGIRPEEVISFGDAKSDLTFIKNSGIGVAMASAPQEVKAVAKIIAESAEQEGVASVIEQLLANSLNA